MSRLDWLVGLLVFVVLLVLAVAGIFLWQQSRLDLTVTPVSEGAVVFEGVPSEAEADGKPALLSFGRAHGRVLNDWQNDASLVTASATWPLVRNADDVRGGQANWNFVFYSPTTSTAVSTNVVNEQVAVSEPYPIYQTLNPLQLNGWQIDSDDALEIFLNNGGEAFLNTQTDVSLTTQLSTINNNTRMEWLISAFANRNGETLTLLIDATSGTVLEIR